jgi:hypothetical protein
LQDSSSYLVYASWPLYPLPQILQTFITPS